MRIALDAGHGTNTKGKRTPDGIREWTLNNAVAKYLAEYLKGYATTFRTDDTSGKTDIGLSTRRNNAVKNGANLLISIHHNAYNGKWNNVTGVEVYRHTLYSHKQAKDLTSKLAAAISKTTGLKNRGAKTGLLGVIATSKIPCILCEGGFMDSKNDYKVITTEAGQRAYAKAIADTIISYYGLKKATSTKTTATKTTTSKAYKVKINTARLNVRAGAGVKYKVKAIVKKDEVYTIVETKGNWGKLKSGAGWISLTYTKKV
jgi:N-acetylmuramoyl-L-alanine amidase